jgi:Ca2+-binding EF-hand superfamily protein
MFATGGKKEILRQIRLARASGVADPLTALGLRKSDLNKSLSAVDETSAARKSPSKSLDNRAKSADTAKRRDKSSTSTISSIVLTKFLKEKSTDGVVMRRIFESTVRYHPDRDSVTLKSFESKEIEYPVFRRHLSSIFSINFTDEEYGHVTKIFDADNNGFIDGFQFNVAFIKLHTLRRDRDVKESKKRQEDIARNREFEEERKRLEAEKKMEYEADTDYSEAARSSAMNKLAVAAKKFDPSHPSAPNLESLTVTYLKPAELKDLLARLFFLKLSHQEMGVLITKYGDKTGNVDVSVFLREFIKIGINGRANDAAEQRKLQMQQDKKAGEERAQKISDAEKKYDMVIDYDFSSLDEARAAEKLKEASVKYDRTSPTAQGLSGFECVSLNPGAFRDLLRRTFHLNLTNKEIGFIIRKYDRENAGKVLCAPFITDFLRTGIEERHKRHVSMLEKQRKAESNASAEQEKKTAAQVQEFNQEKISFDYAESDTESALEKLAKAATKYDRSRGNALESFQCAALTPQEFRDAMFKTFRLSYSPRELGAIVCYFDKTNTGSVRSKLIILFTTTMYHSFAVHSS